MPSAISFEALKYALRQGKDGVILSLVVHPNDLPAEILSAPIGQQWIVALAPYLENPVSASDEQTERSRSSGSGAGRELTPADRAIKMAHTHAGGSEEVLQGIRDYCGVKSCSEFKTNPGALKRFHDWEYINGYVQGRP